MKAHRSYTDEELRYLKMLSRQYPTVREAGTEIINIGDSVRARRIIDGTWAGRHQVLATLERMGFID